jgi:hypothetical protein
MRLRTFYAVAALGLATLGGAFGAQAAGVTPGASAIPELAKTLPVTSYGGEADIVQARWHHRHYYRGRHYGWRHHHYRGHHRGHYYRR